MATKAKKKSTNSESLPQLTKPGTQKKRKNTTPESPPITGLEPIEQGPGSENAVSNMTRKGSRLRKKVTFADPDVEAVPVPKKRQRHLKR